MIKAIVHVGPNWGIGKDGHLLTSFQEDFEMFKDYTKDCVIIYGRKTLDTFPNKKPLRKRFNILLTHDKKKISEDAKNSVGYYCSISGIKDREESLIGGFTIKNKDDARGDKPTYLLIMNKVKYLEHVAKFLNRDVVVIGGESIYKQLLQYCEEVMVTKSNVDDLEADAHFPNLDEMTDWKIANSTIIKTSETSPEISYNFLRYVRIKEN